MRLCHNKNIQIPSKANNRRKPHEKESDRYAYPDGISTNNGLTAQTAK